MGKVHYDIVSLIIRTAEDPGPEVGHSDSPLSLSITIFLSKTRSKIAGVSVAHSNFLSHCESFLHPLSSKNLKPGPFLVVLRWSMIYCKF